MHISKADCTHCSICTELGGAAKPVFGKGPLEARVILVGQNPGAQEVRNGVPFTGSSGQLLNTILTAVGLSREDVYVTNANLCPTKSNRPPTAAEVDACNGRLRAELRDLPNRHVIVPMGNVAIRAVYGVQGSVQRMLFRTDWRDEWGCFVVPTYHPAALMRETEMFPDLAWALQRAAELLALPRQRLQPPPVDYRVEGTDAEIERALEQLADYEGEVACDLETDGLEWMSDTILSVGYAAEGGFGAILPCVPGEPKHSGGGHNRPPPTARTKKLMHAAATNPRIHWIWHNGKFDIKFLRHQLGIEARIDSDTMLMHYKLDERQGTHGLKQLACKYLGVEHWEEDLKKWITSSKVPYSAIPRNVLYKYQSRDICYTYQLKQVLEKLLAEEPPSEEGFDEPADCHRYLLVPAANELALSELHGTFIDTTELHRVDEEVTQSLVTLEASCLKHVPDSLRVDGEFNVRSPLQVARMMYDHLKLPLVGGTRTTDKEALDLYKDRHPFVETLQKYRLQHRLHATYIKGFEERLGPDQRVHPEYLIHGTRTGRLSCSDPNLMNIPRSSPIKKLFAVPPGYVFVQADYKQLEVRTAAWFSNDAQLIEVCKGDVHGSTSERIFAKHLAEIRAAFTLDDLEEIVHRYEVLSEQAHFHDVTPYKDVEVFRKACIKQLRHMTKYVTFGIIYGREAKGLAEGELHCSVREAQEYIDNFYKRFRGLAAWISKVKREAIHRGWLETPSGRRRRFPFVTRDNEWQILKQAPNMPVQSLASDINLRAYTKIAPQLRNLDIGRALFLVHDSIAVELRASALDKGMEIIKREMENAGPEGPVKWEVDLEVGDRWGNTKEYKAPA